MGVEFTRDSGGFSKGDFIGGAFVSHSLHFT